MRYRHIYLNRFFIVFSLCPLYSIAKFMCITTHKRRKIDTNQARLSKVIEI